MPKSKGIVERILIQSSTFLFLGNTYTSVGSHQEQSNSKPQNSPIIWLGKFVFDGLPSKLFNFKSPYSPLYWYNSLNDIAKTSTSNLLGNFG